MSILITAKKDGFCRCGISHPARTTEYPDGRFSEKELKVLQTEPMLVVQIVGGSTSNTGNAGTNGKTLAGNVPDTVALVQAANSIEELDKIAEGESRKGVLDAITKRRAELDKPAE